MKTHSKLLLATIFFIFAGIHTDCFAETDQFGRSSNDDIFLTITKHWGSGCYSLGDTTATYQACMDGKNWLDVERDLDLSNTCKVLDPDTKKREDCLSVSQLALLRFHDQLKRKNRDTLNSIVLDEAGNGKLCFSSVIEIDAYSACLRAMENSADVDAELAKVQHIYSLYTSAFNDGRVRHPNGSITREYSIGMDFNFQKFTSAAESVASDMRDKVARAEEDANEANENSAADQQRLALEAVKQKENKVKSRCGKDYMHPAVGQSESRLKECSHVVKTSDSANGISHYRTPYGVEATVIHGVVTAWQAP